MKTYAEQCGKPVFDWWDFIKRAQAGQVDDVDWRDASDLAGSWVTCACGNQCAELPRSGGVPLDSRLQGLGLRFLCGVENKSVPAMGDALAHIETIVAELMEKKAKR